MACKDGLFPHISLVDRTKLFEDNPINVCYDAKGKDEKPCKNAQEGDSDYARDRNTAVASCHADATESECGDGKVPGAASTRPEKPNVCDDTNSPPLCTDDKNLNDTADGIVCLKTALQPVCNNDKAAKDNNPEHPACTEDGTKFELP